MLNQQLMRRNVSWFQSFCSFWGGKELAKLVLFSGRMYNTEEWRVIRGLLVLWSNSLPDLCCCIQDTKSLGLMDYAGFNRLVNIKVFTRYFVLLALLLHIVFWWVLSIWGTVILVFLVQALCLQERMFSIGIAPTVCCWAMAGKLVIHI